MKRVDMLSEGPRERSPRAGDGRIRRGTGGMRRRVPNGGGLPVAGPRLRVRSGIAALILSRSASATAGLSLSPWPTISPSYSYPSTLMQYLTTMLSQRYPRDRSTISPTTGRRRTSGAPGGT